MCFFSLFPPYVRHFFCRAPVAGEPEDAPDITTFFDDVDKPKLEAEAFELFKTMEVRTCVCVLRAIQATCMGMHELFVTTRIK